MLGAGAEWCWRGAKYIVVLARDTGVVLAWYWPAGRRVSRSPAVFDLDKLNWMNQQYVKKLSLQELSDRLQPFIVATSYADRVARLSAPQREWLMEAVRERMVCLKDIENLLPVFFDPPAKDEEAQAVLSQPGVRQVLETIQAKLPLDEEPEEYRQCIRATVKELKLKAKDVFMPMRCAPDRAGTWP